MKFDNKKLKKIRLEKCKTLEEIADKINEIKGGKTVSKSHIYFWENNGVPSANNTWSLAAALGVNIEKLYS